MLDSFTGFPPDAIRFLRSLKRNNRREWFETHRERYESNVKRPLQLLVEEVDARLGELAPEITGDPKRSVFRIHRDVRFSKDKSPYKTNAAVWFRHRDAGHAVGTRAVHGGAGFYFELGPDGAYLAGGIWMPPTDGLKAIRARIADKHESLREIIDARTFRKQFGNLSTEAVLVRPPKGWAPDHPAIDLLRYKSFTVSQDIDDKHITSAKLPDVLAKSYAAMLPFVRWLNTSLGLSPASRR